jgi:hypothetical protein
MLSRQVLSEFVKAAREAPRMFFAPIIWVVTLLKRIAYGLLK